MARASQAQAHRSAPRPAVPGSGPRRASTQLAEGPSANWHVARAARRPSVNQPRPHLPGQLANARSANWPTRDRPAGLRPEDFPPWRVRPWWGEPAALAVEPPGRALGVGAALGRRPSGSGRSTLDRVEADPPDQVTPPVCDLAPAGPAGSGGPLPSHRSRQQVDPDSGEREARMDARRNAGEGRGSRSSAVRVRSQPPGRGNRPRRPPLRRKMPMTRNSSNARAATRRPALLAGAAALATVAALATPCSPPRRASPLRPRPRRSRPRARASERSSSGRTATRCTCSRRTRTARAPAPGTARASGRRSSPPGSRSPARASRRRSSAGRSARTAGCR